MTQPDPQGARALAERLNETAPIEWGHVQWIAPLILSDHGLFIADVREHEPDLEDRIGSDHEVYSAIVCSCGHVPQITESYFTHINGGPR